MRASRSVVLTLVLALIAVGAAAQTLDRSQAGGAARAVAVDYQAAAQSITQNLDTSTIIGLTGVTCTNGVSTTDTQFYRRFDLDGDHGIASAFTVESVDLGVEVDVPGTNGNPISVNLYSIASGDALVLSNMTPIGGVDLNLDGSNSLSVLNVPVTGTISDPAGQDLVVELRTSDHVNDGTGGQFFPGVNNNGEIAPVYIAAEDCGLVDPLSFPDLGFFDQHNIFVVNGNEDDACQFHWTGVRSGRTDDGHSISWQFELEHNRGDVAVPLYVELQDRRGNVVAVQSEGILELSKGSFVAIGGTFEVPSLEPGFYQLVAKLEMMNGFQEKRKMVSIR